MTGPHPGTPPAEAAATTPAPATPGEAAFRHYMTGGDRPDLARQAWLTLSFEVRDRWEEVAGAAIAHAMPPGWVDQIRQDRDALKGERNRLATEKADLERKLAEAGALLDAVSRRRPSASTATPTPTIPATRSVNDERHQHRGPGGRR